MRCRPLRELCVIAAFVSACAVAEAVELSAAEREAALRSAAALGLNVCGVDMLRASRGPVVIEVNSSPGIEGMETATKADVAGAMITFLERAARQGETGTKGSG